MRTQGLSPLPLPIFQPANALVTDFLPGGRFQPQPPAVFTVDLVVSDDGKQLLTAHSNGWVALWDVAQKKRVWCATIETQDGEPFFVNRVAFSPDGKTVAEGRDFSCVVLRDIGTGKEVRRFDAAKHKVLASLVKYTSDGSQIITAGPELRFWSAKDGKLIRSLPTPLGCTVAVSPDDKYALLGRPDRLVSLCDIASGKIVWSSRYDHFPGVRPFTFSPDGKLAPLRFGRRCDGQNLECGHRQG